MKQASKYKLAGICSEC